MFKNRSTGLSATHSKHYYCRPALSTLYLFSIINMSIGLHFTRLKTSQKQSYRSSCIVYAIKTNAHLWSKQLKYRRLHAFDTCKHRSSKIIGIDRGVYQLRYTFRPTITSGFKINFVCIRYLQASFVKDIGRL